MRQLYKSLALSCAICAFRASASAVLVDWSVQNWPTGSLSNSYDVDPSNPENDVTITVSGNTGQSQPAAGTRPTNTGDHIQSQLPRGVRCRRLSRHLVFRSLLKE